MHRKEKSVGKILVVTGARSEYGILYPLMKAIKESRKFHLLTVLTGMHLSREFGDTARYIKKDGFSVQARIHTINKSDTNTAMAAYVGQVIQKSVPVLKRLKPDLVLLLGDRLDILATAVAAAYMNIAIAHIHGGDLSNGGLDESARHAITRFAHIHFAATRKSAERIIKMGEESFRVYVVGALGLESIIGRRLLSRREFFKKYNIRFSDKPVLLIIQHSVTTQPEQAARQMKETMEAIRELGYLSFVIYPNADAGGRAMIRVIERYRKYPFIRIFPSLPHQDYLSLMKTAQAMVGNSSSGIIEAPSFHLPVVDIGIRQKGRERTGNIIETRHDKNKIIKAIKRCLRDTGFKNKVKGCKSPYGDGKASARIVKILSSIKITEGMLQKRITY